MAGNKKEYRVSRNMTYSNSETALLANTTLLHTEDRKTEAKRSGAERVMYFQACRFVSSFLLVKNTKNTKIKIKQTHRIGLSGPQLDQISFRRRHELGEIGLRPPREQVLLRHGAAARRLDAADAGHVRVVAAAGHARHEESVLASLAHALFVLLLLPAAVEWWRCACKREGRRNKYGV